MIRANHTYARSTYQWIFRFFLSLLLWVRCAIERNEDVEEGKRKETRHDATKRQHCTSYRLHRFFLSFFSLHQSIFLFFSLDFSSSCWKKENSSPLFLLLFPVFSLFFSWWFSWWHISIIYILYNTIETGFSPL